MHTWPLQEAKAKLSEVVKSCTNEPQIISLRGEEKVIMLTIEDYKKIIEKNGDLVSFFARSPLKGVDITLERDSSSSRDIIL